MLVSHQGVSPTFYNKMAPMGEAWTFLWKFQQKGLFQSVVWEKQISPLLCSPTKLLEISPSAHPEKIQ